MRRILNRLDLRKNHEEPPGPQPVDYLRMIKTWLQDERTKAPFPLQDIDLSDYFLCLWVLFPLPPVYQGTWSTGSLAGGQREADRRPPGPKAGDDAGNEEPERMITLRIWLDELFSLDIDFELPHQQIYASELEPSETEPHKLYVYEELGLEEDGSVLKNVDFFDEDSATLLNEELSRFGIDLYCPVRSIGDALADVN
jgi:hypothetical protein